MKPSFAEQVAQEKARILKAAPIVEFFKYPYVTGGRIGGNLLTGQLLGTAQDGFGRTLYVIRCTSARSSVDSHDIGQIYEKRLSDILSESQDIAQKWGETR
jgi:hypothetical protein